MFTFSEKNLIMKAQGNQWHVYMPHKKLSFASLRNILKPKNLKIFEKYIKQNKAICQL